MITKFDNMPSEAEVVHKIEELIDTVNAGGNITPISTEDIDNVFSNTESSIIGDV